MTPPLLLRWVFALALLAAVPAVGLAQRQRPTPAPDASRPQPPSADGSEYFRLLLELRKIKPIARVDELTRMSHDELRDVIVIVLGGPRVMYDGVDTMLELGRVLRAGGAVLVASDTPLRLELNSPRRVATAQILGNHIWATQRGTYHRSFACPYVAALPLPGGATEIPERLLFANLDRVATNLPSCIGIDSYIPPFRYPLAALPRGSVDDRANQLTAEFRRNWPFAIGGSGPDPVFSNRPYRFLLMADSGVFINQMLIDPSQTPTDNLEFADRVVEYLQDPQGQNRRRCLFLENGRPVERFDTAAALLLQHRKPPAAPNPLAMLLAMQQKMVSLGNEVIASYERNDGVNRMILGSRDPERQDRRLRQMIAGMLVLLSMWAVVQLLRRVWRARAPTDLPPALIVPRPAVPGAGGPAGLFDRRQRELLRRNNVYEPVRDLIREMFAAAGAPPHPGPKLPPIRVGPEVTNPESLRKALADLWAIGYGPPKVVTLQLWGLMQRLFVRARQAHADGKWQFAGV